MTMTDVPLFEIRPIPSPGQASPDAIVIGPEKEVWEYIPQSVARQDAANELEAKLISAEQIEKMQEANRVIQAKAVCDTLAHTIRRFGAEVARREERARKDAKEKAAREQQLIEDALSKLPDPDNPILFGDDTPSPDGHLHQLEASRPEDREQLEAADDEGIGDLPKELLKDVPAEPGTEPEFPTPRKPTARAPVAVSLKADSLYANHSMGTTMFTPDPVRSEPSP
jgi:hypothetical protein